METLRQLLSTSSVGQKLLAALEPHASTALPALVAAMLQETLQDENAAVSREPTRVSLDDAASVVSGLTFLTPRGKQDLAFFEDHCVVKTSKADLVIPYTAIQNLAIVEMPKDTKKRVFLYLNISQDAKVMNGKQLVTAVVIQTVADGQLDIANPKEPGERLQGPAAVVVCQAFGIMNLPPCAFCSPDGEAFRSSEGHTGCQAYVKASQGMLFPMAQGLAFLERPATFIPRAAIRSVEFVRAGGTSSTFDFYVHRRDGGLQEFGNISRNELGVLEDYVRRCRLPVGTGESSEEEEGQEGGGQGGAVASGGSCSENSGVDSDSDDPEDEDFNPTSSSSSDEEHEEAEGREGAAGSEPAAAGGRRAGVSASTAGGSKRKAAGSGSEAAAGSGGGGDSSSDDSSEEDDDSSDESSTDDEDDEGSVEVVSEDDFSRGQLRSVIEAEGPKQKRQRR